MTDPQEDMMDAVSHIREATNHLEKANDELESDGEGTGYVGEEHMTEALYALKQCVEAREEAQDE